jgi:hypothetical protein
VSADASAVSAGWRAIGERLRGELRDGRNVLCVECYPGVLLDEIERPLAETLRPALVVRSADCFQSPDALAKMLQPVLTGDPVFGRMNGIEVADFFDPAKAEAARRAIAAARGMVLVIGTGASLLALEPRVLVYADLARWEIQQRQRSGKIGNLGAENAGDVPSLLYKRSFFVDWRAADRLKTPLLSHFDFFLDTNRPGEPKLIPAAALRQALRTASERPFRLVPFFDPGPWGGQWMKHVCDLPDGPPNYAWCFDCVPEENSLLFDFGDVRIESPALNLVFQHPRELLGDAVYQRFGAEFPIRFDFLDTWEGGNLSLQVHPLAEYIRKNFGIPYTQDESYYLLDAKEDGTVFLGLKEGMDRHAMERDLWAAQRQGKPFPAERYVNRWPAKQHDHFLIPAGTIHCSGRNALVLEISATPYLFTFKLWDWGRMGLDGRPRPIHIEHGLANIQWDRTAAWVRENLVNRFETLGEGDGWREERTGLHPLEFIETRRHWFRKPVPHRTEGSVNVLNLVQGEEIAVESPSNSFEPLVVHYAETFVVPACIGEYRIRPLEASSTGDCATIKAYVRTR